MSKETSSLSSTCLTRKAPGIPLCYSHQAPAGLLHSWAGHGNCWGRGRSSTAATHLPPQRKGACGQHLPAPKPSPERAAGRQAALVREPLQVKQNSPCSQRGLKMPGQMPVLLPCPFHTHSLARSDVGPSAPPEDRERRLRHLRSGCLELCRRAPERQG